MEQRILPLISFVVPVRDDAARLQRCLDAIARSDYPKARIDVIIVDNGSSDGSADVGRQAGATVVTLEGMHVGSLRNQGARMARGEVLAFADADHEIDAGWLKSATETLTGASVAAAGAPCHAPPDGTWVQLTYDALRDRRPGCSEVEWLGAGNLAVWRKRFEEIGGFDATLETCEDVDLCQRLRARGYRVIHDERLRSVHLGDPPTLRALFFGELWRGRGNVHASLRAPLSLRGLPSLVIPVIDLGGLLAGLLSVAFGPFVGATPAVLGASAIGGFASLRAARMIARRRSVRPLAVLQAFAVACVYDLARALAVVIPASHRARRLAAIG